MNDQADLQKKNDLCIGVCVCTYVEAEKTVDELNSIKILHTGDEKISELKDKIRNYPEYNRETSSWRV